MKTIHTRGFPFSTEVPNPRCKLILINQLDKIVIDTIQGDYLVCSETASWKAGTYKFQLQDDTGILSEGSFEVLQNFALASEDEVTSRWEKVLQAIDAVIEGRASQAEKDVSVGDKRIGYMDFEQLLKMREFVKTRIAEEKAQAKGKTKADFGKIKYFWRSI